MTLLTFPSHAQTIEIERPASALLVRPQRDARFYDGEGRPVLYVPYADPKREGETRRVTLADARKLGLYPSVTTALSIIDRPAIRAWQATQYIMAALTLPRLPDETLDAFAVRVVEDGEAYRNQAADEGRDLHEAIADYLAGRDDYTYRGEWSAHLRAFATWWAGSGYRCLAAEHAFINRDLGYGGMVDALITDKDKPERLEDLIICDWKTATTEPGKPVKFYDEWAIQLGGYAQRGPRLVNVVISRTEPGRIELKEWTDPELQWARFHAALCLWKLLNNYYPGVAS
jgi:hypothetical protein